MSRNLMNENVEETKRFYQNKIFRNMIIIIGVLLTLATISLAVWIFRLNANIRTRFAEKRFAPPVEFYSAPEQVRTGGRFPVDYFEGFFKRKNYRKRDFSEPVRGGDYSVWSGDQCLTVVPAPQVEEQKPAKGATSQSDPATQAANHGAATSQLAPAPGLTGAVEIRKPTPAAGAAVPSLPNAPNIAPGSVAGAGVPNVRPKVANCIAFKSATHSASDAEENSVSVEIIAFGPQGEILQVYTGKVPTPVESISIEPELFAQYFGESPTLRTVVPLGTTPTMCLNGLLAIEDANFLTHSGVSITGLLRAFVTNLRSGRAAQGGSTITQQLVKNYFLNDKKTLGRKLTEIAMAFLVEQHASKDDILETYINLIYMGQNGPFQVRGFAAAAEHYFGKDLSDLGLDQCALLAAILNSPGLYNPFIHPDHALKRRALVLDRMSELKMITADEAKIAKASPLPLKPQHSLTEPAPYFVQAVRRFIEEQGLDDAEGLRVYTTLNLRAQEAAQQAVRTGLERIEKSHPQIQKIKAQGKSLEAVLISSDPSTGFVESLVGGRGFLATQFNRAIESHRQVGSVMKPFVYLAALEHRREDGSAITAMTTLKDEATTHRFEGQTWTPHNYEGTYLGPVPLFYALKESLNAATVNLGMEVGLANIIDLAQRMGVTSKMKALPSLTLGAFELSPMEVLESYGTIARFGARTPLTLVHEIDDLIGHQLYLAKSVPQNVVAPETVAQLIGIMKQTIFSGTGRGVRLSGFTAPAAGKTGTTNDKKDAWFAGFSPYHAALVWVGYDDNTSHNLTGATGAVPIWAQYMKTYGSTFPAKDFAWPPGIERALLSSEEQIKIGIPGHKGEQPLATELIFLKGQTPPGLTPIDR